METLKPVPAYVGGTWEASENIATITNPYTGELVGKVCLGDAKMAKKGLLAAKEAYGQYKKLPAHARARLLGQILDGIEARKKSLPKRSRSSAASQFWMPKGKWHARCLCSKRPRKRPNG